MAEFTVTGSDVVRGSLRNDVYTLDPDLLVSARIVDAGGAADVLHVYDRPGRTAGEFVVEGSTLIWRNFVGGEVRMALNSDGTSPIEFFRWERLAEDGAPYVQTNRILLPGQAITTTNVTVVTTQGNDSIVAPHFATFQGGATEIYGNRGNDSLTASDSTFSHFYGGPGRDLLRGTGNVADDFSGDAGADRLLGVGGDDWLDGGDGNDTVNGGAGADEITGGQGDDLLSGGAGPDVFLYNPKEIGIDKVLDYTAGDIIRVSGAAPSAVHVAQQGADVLITIDDGATILLLKADGNEVAIEV